MRFLLDAMLGKLARYLRMCGYDTAYALDRGVEADDEVLALAESEDRRLVTRDADLVARAEGSLLIESKEIDGQLCELRDAGVSLSLTSPERCSRCNGRVERVGDHETPGYAPDPGEERVWRCRDCGQHYWKGSHWDDVNERLPE